MDNVIIKSTYFRADQLLKAAQRELLKSQDDTVPFMICSNARKSIGKHLKGYLLTNGIDPIPSATIKQLALQCRELNPKFNEVDIEELFCGNESQDNHFCTDLKKVESCVDVAIHIRNLIQDDHWPESKRVK